MNKTIDNFEVIYRDIISITNKTYYLNKEIEYLKNVKITEYDVKSAGWTIVKKYKLLSDSEISYLQKLTKQERNIYIGNAIRKNPNINKVILETLRKARLAFCIINKIDPSSILSIKKDAIFVIKQNAEKLNIEGLTFVPKNQYSSYAYINGKEFYYSENKFDIKGISDELKTKSASFINELRTYFKLAEISSGKELSKIIIRKANKYLNKELPIDCYRSLDTGNFNMSLYNNKYDIQDISKDQFDIVDISKNYINYIIPLVSVLI